MNLKEQKKVALVVFFSVGFFIYGVSGEKHMNENSSMFAKKVKSSPQRGIASIPD